MKLIIIFFIIVIILFIISVVIRKIVSNYMTNINQEAKFNTNVNYLYDDYYENMDKKEGKDLVGNFGIIRYNFMDGIYESEIKILKLNKDKLNKKQNYNILNLSLTNCNFDIYLLNKFDNLVIHSLITNLNDYNICKKKITSLNLDNKLKIHYGKYSDIGNIFKDKKFDRIVILETIGKISKKPEFIKQLKPLLKDENSFIYLKTMVFIDLILDNKFNKGIQNEIYEKQKYMINYWNYNFSSNQAIINDFHKEGFKNIKMKTISVLFLFFTYNIEDILNLLRLYFVDLGLGVRDLHNWFILFTLNISNFIIY